MLHNNDEISTTLFFECIEQVTFNGQTSEGYKDRPRDTKDLRYQCQIIYPFVSLLSI